MSSTYIFFMQRTAKTTQRIPLTPLQITRVIVEPKKISVKCTNGQTHVSVNPTPKERAYWSTFRVPVEQTSTRWDMPCPDPLALAALEDYEHTKQLK
jgi:hypothetical protein